MSYVSLGNWWVRDVIAFYCGPMDFNRAGGCYLVLFHWMVSVQWRPHWKSYCGRWDHR